MYYLFGIIFDNGYEQEIESEYNTKEEAVNAMNYYENPSDLCVTDESGSIVAERF